MDTNSIEQGFKWSDWIKEEHRNPEEKQLSTPSQPLPDTQLSHTIYNVSHQSSQAPLMRAPFLTTHPTYPYSAQPITNQTISVIVLAEELSGSKLSKETKSGGRLKRYETKVRTWTSPYERTLTRPGSSSSFNQDHTQPVPSLQCVTDRTHVQTPTSQLTTFCPGGLLIMLPAPTMLPAEILDNLKSFPEGTLGAWVKAELCSVRVTESETLLRLLTEFEDLCSLKADRRFIAVKGSGGLCLVDGKSNSSRRRRVQKNGRPLQALPYEYLQTLRQLLIIHVGEEGAPSSTQACGMTTLANSFLATVGALIREGCTDYMTEDGGVLPGAVGAMFSAALNPEITMLRVYPRRYSEAGHLTHLK